MPGSDEQFPQARSGRVSPDVLGGALGHGMVARSVDSISHYVVVPQDYLPTGRLVYRYDEETVLVSVAAPTKPSGRSGTLTQSELVRKFMDEELALTGKPTEHRPTSLTGREVAKQIKED